VKATNLRKGAITDSLGHFELMVSPDIDSMRFSMMGYQTITRAITKKTSQEINLSLTPETNTLTEVVVYPKGYDPAVHLFKKILEHKEQNNPAHFNNYQSEVYDKLQFEAGNFSEKAIGSRLLKPFSFVFTHTDPGASPAKPRVPLFITESLADYY
ncbi:carboxypeptidase-like regulatory domain-containing protein, partial [Escherichia coli]